MHRMIPGLTPPGLVSIWSQVFWDSWVNVADCVVIFICIVAFLVYLSDLDNHLTIPLSDEFAEVMDSVLLLARCFYMVHWASAPA